MVCIILLSCYSRYVSGLLPICITLSFSCHVILVGNQFAKNIKLILNEHFGPPSRCHQLQHIPYHTYPDPVVSIAICLSRSVFSTFHWNTISITMSGEISGRSRKRGAVRGSITWLQTKIIGLQADPRTQDTQLHAQRIAEKLEVLDSDFKTHHLSIFELVENEEVLAEEQAISDEHDDIVAEIAVAIERLLSSSESSPSEAHSIAEKATVSCRLTHLQRVVETAEIVDPTDTDICLLEQLEGK